MLPQVTVTPAAEKFMRRIVRFSGLPADAGLRLSVAAGGCSGYSSEFSAAAGPAPGEEVLSVNGLPVFLAAESRLLLEGFTIDFVETASSTGLSFSNPNQASCACSTSGDSKPAVAHVDVAAIGRGRPLGVPVAS